MSKLKESSVKNLHILTKSPSISAKPFKRHLSNFLRVADLMGMDEDIQSATSATGSDCCNDNVSTSSSLDATATATNASASTATAAASRERQKKRHPNYHHASIDPPPGVEEDPLELWITLDDGDGRHAPIAPYAVRALARTGMTHAFDRSMWTPDGKTSKLLARRLDGWQDCAWQEKGQVEMPDDKHVEQVLVWTGTFGHGLYGSDLPAVRACAVLDIASCALLNLLVDSDRVQEYNKLSLGRTDDLVLQDDGDVNGPFGGVTKVMTSKSRPPLLRKTLVFTSILHARELEDKSGYKIVTRAVERAKAPHEDANVLTSEILMGVTMIKRIAGHDDRCLVITVNHIRSPLLPMMIAKRIGLQAAVNFLHDLRACC